MHVLSQHKQMVTPAEPLEDTASSMGGSSKNSQSNTKLFPTHPAPQGELAIGIHRGEGASLEESS